MTVTFSATTESSCAAAASSAAAVFDIEALTVRCMGDAVLAARLLARFGERLPKAVSEIERCLAAGSRDDAIQRAHSLKGEAGSLAAGLLQQAAAELEHCLRGQPAGVPPQAQSLVEALRSAADRCQQHLPATLSALSARSAT